MTSDITAYEAPNGVQVFDPTASSSNSLAVLKQHAEAMSVAFKLASSMAKTTLVPKIYQGEPENATAAILYGMELGLNPIQSLQQIFVVHGTPAIYARTMVALVMSHGHRIWTVASTDESVTVAGQRNGEEIVESTWTIDRATKAGYVPQIDPQTGEYAKNKWGKLDGNMKYLTDPQGMLYAKAAATVCRQIAPDILLGIAYTAEDLQSEQSDEQQSSVVQRKPRGNGDGGAAWRDRLGLTSKDHAGEALAPAAAAEVAAEAPSAPADAPSEPEPAAPNVAEPTAEPQTEPTTDEQAAMPTPENPVVEFVTPARLKTLRTALTKAGITEPKERAAFVRARIGGRDIQSMDELTAAEADSIMQFLAETTQDQS
ncbi:hypothetical protein ACTHQY_09045 [Rhodococcoides corynebacterioides]|uniref:hypothetical protein n=1 Tax=Rhodococcoides corynebacterioides TaxID=53972 RepID=UPI003F7E2629